MRSSYSNPNFNEKKALNAVLYIAQSISNPDMHHVAKILYFAEREHLSRFGRAIVNDDYVAMPYGPVPSSVYDIFKALRGDGKFSEEVTDRFRKYFNIINRQDIQPSGDPNLDVFSDSELDAIEKSIDENKNLNFSSRSNKSHDAAWKATPKNRKIEKENIAKAGGADEGMVVYMREVDDYKSYQPTAR